ncbi:MAG: N-acetyl sugar amidotransferase [Bacteroidetes bacterium]|nr:N-acetyl sugar amidotransferase [Bacteroidota bacterium]
MKLLVISDDYPRPDLIYGDVFVHTRVLEYAKMHTVTVAGYRPGLSQEYDFVLDGIPVVISNSFENFKTIILSFDPDVIIAHFINSAYMEFLLDTKKPLITFIHGYEATSWRRRLMNYKSPGAWRYLVSYIKSNRKQLAALRSFVADASQRPNSRFVFVSKWIKEATEKDLGLGIPASRIIPNGINTNLFSNAPKEEKDRLKILLLRSFKAQNYANDIAIEAIQLLKEKDFFNELEFFICGEGFLFEKLTQPIREYPNVKLQNVFIENKTIPSLHSRYGIFLCPSRLDTQGVSMCEAMASGLVPITSPIGGIPEYATHGRSSFQVHTAREVADSIEYLYRNPKEFLRMSVNARNEILEKCDLKETVSMEMNLISEVVKEKAHHKQCTHCLLDNLDDPAITFDEKGVCNYCRKYEAEEKLYVKHGAEGKAALEKIISNVKLAGEGKQYDCILGLSGGVDSSYLALKAKEFGLRPLAVHFDNGWNSELAVKNIEQIISKLGIDLYTLVIDWAEFRDLQLALIKASVVDIEMVTDHAILATLYKLAIKYDIKYILSGTNYVTEAILPRHWIHHKADYVHIRALQEKFNSKPFVTYPLFDLKLRTRAELAGITSVSPLNFMDYNKEEAKKELAAQLGWRDYGGKHYESVFTRFYQGYILPKKFHIDKRKAHLSNLICSGQLTRAQAQEELAKPIYDESLMKSDYDFVIKKLGLTAEEFEKIMATPPKLHTDYPVEKEIYERMPFLKLARPVWQFFKRTVKKTHGHNS